MGKNDELFSKNAVLESSLRTTKLDNELLVKKNNELLAENADLESNLRATKLENELLRQKLAELALLRAPN